jgi:hypothetical protein
MNIVNGYLNVYYNMIIAYSLYFLVLSFTSRLPWESCNAKWSSESKDYTINIKLLLKILDLLIQVQVTTIIYYFKIVLTITAQISLDSTAA